MPTTSLLSSASEPSRAAAIQADPALVLDLIAQAELKMRDLERWRDHIHADACLLLARVRHERAEHSVAIACLDTEVKRLRERSAEAERVACLALADRENALIQCAMANARALEAERQVEAAETRAGIAEDWLSKLQDVMTAEFFGELHPVLQLDRPGP